MKNRNLPLHLRQQLPSAEANFEGCNLTKIKSIYPWAMSVSSTNFHVNTLDIFHVIILTNMRIKLFLPVLVLCTQVKKRPLEY
jgi:hypothetical protein